jgi:hypothetical protein
MCARAGRRYACLTAQNFCDATGEERTIYSRWVHGIVAVYGFRLVALGGLMRTNHANVGTVQPTNVVQRCEDTERITIATKTCPAGTARLRECCHAAKEHHDMASEQPREPQTADEREPNGNQTPVPRSPPESGSPLDNDGLERVRDSYC